MSFHADAFRRPSINCEPIYSWIWDAPADETGVRNRMYEMYDNGIRALYIIPEPKDFRPSTMTTTMSPEYMSEDFMHLMRVVSDTAEKLGMSLWLYDEGGWPSGSVCTQINQRRPDLARKVILSSSFRLSAGVCYHPSDKHADFLAAFIQINNEEPVRVTDSYTGAKPFMVTEFRTKALVSQSAELTYNTDIADPDTGRLFIEMTHEKYRATLSDQFGLLIPVMFNDEPGLNPNPWTPGLDQLFMEKYGYDMCDYLPWITRQLKWKTDAQRQAIIDYRMLICELLLKNFFLPIRCWCEKNNLSSAGHLNGEHMADFLIYDIHTYGNPLEILRSYHIPGVDAIWGQIRPGNNSSDPCVPFFPRLASSAARQMGNDLALTESMAVYGDGSTPDMIRYVIGFQAVRGINLFNLMNMAYGDEGVYGLVERPVFKSCKPGFAHLRELNRYLARLSYLGQLGPTDTHAALYLPVNDLLVGESADSYHQLGNELEALHIDFDIVDDAILRRAVLENGCLRVGIAAYSRIYIPEGARIPDDVKKKIMPFLIGDDVAVFHCSQPLLRGQKRVLPDGSVICMIFNEDDKPVEDMIDLLDPRPAYLLSLTDGNIYAAPGDRQRISLESGETAVYLLTDKPVETNVQLSEKAWELSLETFTLSRVKQFLITPEGISARTIQEEAKPIRLGVGWAEHYGWEFSGEAIYRCTVDLLEDPKPGDRYELDLGTVEYTADVTINGYPVGIAALSPYKILLTNDQLARHSVIEIKVANTAANQCVSADFRSFWPERAIGPYHEKQLVFEREVLGGGLIGPVFLRKMNSDVI
ncbi:MAG: glycosyl hydrolase [Christensenellales bacterium]|jgi:hypothetical protein